MTKIAILCIDDEPTILSTLERELQKILGYEYLIETTECPEEALELLSELLEEQYEIPLVICDYIMPRLKGEQLSSG